MKWLRSLVTFNVILWTGVLVLTSISAFVVQTIYRANTIFSSGLEPFPDCGCTLASVWSSGALSNGTSIGLLVFGSAVLIWSAISAFRVISATYQFNRWARSIRKLREHRKRVIDVLQTDEPLLFCYGLVEPRVAVSQMIVDSLPEKELDAMLQHEFHHQQTNDPLKLALLQWLEQTFFFIPGFRDMVKLSRLAIEMEADQAIEQPHEMRKALVRHIGWKVGKLMPKRSVASVAYFSVTEARLDILVGRTPAIKDRTLIWGLLLPGVMVAVFIFFAQSSGVFAKEYRLTGANCQATAIEQQSQMYSPLCESPASAVRCEINQSISTQ